MPQVVSKEERSSVPARALYRGIEWAFERLTWLPAWLNYGATAAAGILFVISGAPGTDEFRPAAFVWGCVASLISISAGILNDYLRRQATSEQTSEGGRFQLALEQGIVRGLEDLTKLATYPSDRRDRPYQRVIDTVGNVMPLLFNADVRVVVYRLVRAPRSNDYLRVEDHHGRRGTPRRFVANDGGRGQAVFEWLEKCDSLFVDDISVSQLPGWQGSGKGYRTFISAAIYADKKPLGMLTVDAPEPGDLDETDKGLVEAFAGLLSTAFSLTK